MSANHDLLVPATEPELAALAPSQRLIEHDHPRRYALLRVGTRATYGIAWHSDGIEPIVVESPTAVIWIGIDQRVAAVSGKDARPLLLLPVDTSVLELQAHPNVVVVLTETQLLAFNPDGTFRAVHGFPDVAESVTVEGRRARVTLSNGETIELVVSP